MATKKKILVSKNEVIFRFRELTTKVENVYGLKKNLVRLLTNFNYPLPLIQLFAIKPLSLCNIVSLSQSSTPTFS